MVKNIMKITKIKYNGNPKLFARKYIENYGLTRAFDIFKFAKELGIEVLWTERLRTTDSKVAWGQLRYKNKTQPQIILSDEIVYENSIRFTLAHEIAHYLIDEKGTEDIAWKIKFMFDKKEAKYNTFAINLLIPNEDEYADNFSKMTISQLATHYQVPITMIELYNKWNGYKYKKQKGEMK